MHNNKHDERYKNDCYHLVGLLTSSATLVIQGFAFCAKVCFLYTFMLRR